MIWWRIVKVLSKSNEKQRRHVLDRIRVGCGLADTWRLRYQEDPIYRQRFFLLTLEKLRHLAGANMFDRSTLSKPSSPHGDVERVGAR
jgi:hypothetical protein